MQKSLWFVMLIFCCMNGRAMAAEWVPIKQGEDTVREVDQGSIMRIGTMVSFTSRYTFGSLTEYQVGRRGAKYLQITSRVNCKKHTIAKLATEAYDENMALISKQSIQQAQDAAVAAGSIDELMLGYVCAAGKPPLR